MDEIAIFSKNTHTIYYIGTLIMFFFFCESVGEMTQLSSSVGENSDEKNTYIYI